MSRRFVYATYSQAQEIIARYKNGEKPYAFCKDYNISHCQARRIGKGEVVIPNPESFAIEGEILRECISHKNNFSTNLGRVIGPRGVRTQFVNKSSGYFILKIGSLTDGTRETAYAHDLVAEAWIGPKPDGVTVNHKDGNKLNNIPENLEYATYSENISHAYRLGLNSADKKYRPRYGESCSLSKFTDEQAEEIRSRYFGGETAKSIGIDYGVKPDTIYGIVHRRKRKDYDRNT